MEPNPPEPTVKLELSLLLSRYPVLAMRIRQEMRRELVRRGIVSHGELEERLAEAARMPRESLQDTAQWDLRVHRTQRALTDVAFTSCLPIGVLFPILETLQEVQPRPVYTDQTLLEKLLRQAALCESRIKAIHKADSLTGSEDDPSVQLLQARQALLERIVSSQKAFLQVAGEWFTTEDIFYILEHRIGTGRIGGKAAGMLLAYKILEHTAPDLFHTISVPRSYFIGAEVFASFLAENGIDQITRAYSSFSYEQMRADYPAVQEACICGRFPEEIADQLRAILHESGNTPMIVRSSSLLEDSFNQSFAGKYISIFCPNQGSKAENLRDLTLAVRRTYASVFNPDAIIYRRQMGLLEDEHMAILLQKVQGQRHRQWYFPSVAGVAYSYSPFVWNPRLKREQGFTRLVLGLGTRAVDRTGSDYARMVHLSHPQLRPEVTPAAIRRYSQRSIDVLDLATNQLTTQAVEDILHPDLSALRWLVSLDDGDTVRPPVALGLHFDPSKLVLTFDRLLQHSTFTTLLKDVLANLSRAYRVPVDIEYAVCLFSGKDMQPRIDFFLLQCRPQMRWKTESGRSAPANLSQQDTFLIATRMVPLGEVRDIEYIVVVDPEAYQQMGSSHELYGAARLVGRLNQELTGHRFILIGPGRWGSSDAVQGVPVTYGDIYHAGALIEWTGIGGGFASEPSYGTHFFQDLIETQIYPLAVNQDDPGDFLNIGFIHSAKDRLPAVLPQTEPHQCVKLIHIPSERPGCLLELVMDGERAVAYFDSQPRGSAAQPGEQG
ncbi:MAG: PEP/pyruvate-binding domain-containing protein [Anaerolineales bacterium]|nr:PEP/pyruvate-binding domain-containing protein [Anaerolineales bacterium]